MTDSELDNLVNQLDGLDRDQVIRVRKTVDNILHGEFRLRRMSYGRSLSVCYRDGKIQSAYLNLDHDADAVWEGADGYDEHGVYNEGANVYLVDYGIDHKPFGVEMISPLRVTLSAINRVLVDFGAQLMTPEEFDPLELRLVDSRGRRIEYSEREEKIIRERALEMDTGKRPRGVLHGSIRYVAPDFDDPLKLVPDRPLTVTEIQAAVQTLSKAELAAFRDWLEDFIINATATPE